MAWAASPANRPRARSPSEAAREPGGGLAARSARSGRSGTGRGAAPSQRRAQEVRGRGCPSGRGRARPAVRYAPASRGPKRHGGLADRAGSARRRCRPGRGGPGAVRGAATPGRAGPAAWRRRRASRCRAGATAEQGSWRKPGRVSSSVRAPPPTVSMASNTATEKPRRASSTAAVSPLGPAPTTTASSIDGTFGLLCQPMAKGIQDIPGAPTVGRGGVGARGSTVARWRRRSRPTRGTRCTRRPGRSQPASSPGPVAPSPRPGPP